jgi:hypothetical protein
MQLDRRQRHMDARLNFIERAIRGCDIAIEHVRNQGQAAARMIERDDRTDSYPR